MTTSAECRSDASRCRLTYRPLGAAGDVKVGRVFGYDSANWPYVVRAAEHHDDRTVLVLVPMPVVESDA